MRRFLPLGLALGLLLAISSCIAPQATADAIAARILVDGKTLEVHLPAGSTVQQALDEAGVQLNSLDRVAPPPYALVQDGTEVSVTRVEERFEIEQIPLPFDRQTLPNETLPEGETRLLQPGQNGLQEVTYRILLEAGVEISRAPVKSVTLSEPVPEIVMVGTQSATTPVVIEGRLLYMASGNAWLMEGNSANRMPILVSGDLDGRIFRVSPDGRWLLFSRVSDDEDVINELWITPLDDSEPEPIYLGVDNVVHFADWVPEVPSRSIAFSTVEPSPGAPGWQANNDLQIVNLTQTGRPMAPRIIVDSNAGGQYGWWGTEFLWGSDPAHLAYARADGFGLVDLDSGRLEPARQITPYQTLSDWAWVPGIAWSPDHQTLYFIDHGPPAGLESPQASPIFNLAAKPRVGPSQLTLVERTGMFAFPRVSPLLPSDTAEVRFRIAFLEAVHPLESENSGYRLAVIDRDGSNHQVLFPPQNQEGLEPARPGPVWSPSGSRIAIIYQGDLWIVDIATGAGQQLTADGQVETLAWAP